MMECGKANEFNTRAHVRITFILIKTMERSYAPNVDRVM